MIRVSCEPSNETSKVLIKAGFREVFTLNHKDPATTFVHSNGMKIDFLTPMTGKATSKPMKLQGAGVFAEPLRFLDYLIEDPQESAIITRNGILVHVPQAARYALHKCVIYQYRNSDTKKAKDLLQAESILEVLEDSMPHLITKAWGALPWKDKALTGISELRSAGLKERLAYLINKPPADDCDDGLGL